MIITDLPSIEKRVFKRNTRNFFVPFLRKRTEDKTKRTRTTTLSFAEEQKTKDFIMNHFASGGNTRTHTHTLGHLFGFRMLSVSVA